MPAYTKEHVISWLALIRDEVDFLENEFDEPGLARAAIEFLKATMPALEGDDA